MANQLADQTSPYLQQHADQPVDWRPWGPAALAEARAENKPILLSIGYTACHWCHVMAHESFDDPDIAELVNSQFIPIKVDREERPDLDAIYQQALTLMGGAGGWPLTMFLTPEGDAYWGGTYFPPEPRPGHYGFSEVLQLAAAAWTGQRDSVTETVTALKNGLARERTGTAAPLTLDTLDDYARQIARLVDRDHGGLGGAPKFPQPAIFDTLWRAALRTGEAPLAQAVTVTLDRLCQGGIFDHLGGGFMRYAVDENWLVPHFEKMLYDNALLVDLLTLAWQGTANPLYRQRVVETVEWVLREMVAEGGAFASSLDADSEGEEGAFYTWHAEDIERLLDHDTARLFAAAYDVRPEGNWEGRTILHRVGPPLSAEDEAHLADARAVLWRERENRPRPGRDDKVLADWNGMMIAALANAAFVFAMPRWLDAARVAYATVRTAMALPDHRLAHALRFGRTNGIGLIDDLAYMARAAFTLAEVTGEAAYLDDARAWLDAAERHHGQPDGSHLQAAHDAKDIVIHLQPIHDGATPAPVGVLAHTLARLWQATGDDGARRRAEAILSIYGAELSQRFPVMTALLAAFEQLARPRRITIAGPGQRTDTRALLRAVADSPLPTRVLLHADGTRADTALVEGHSTAWVCDAASCLPPITDASRLRQTLAAR